MNYTVVYHNIISKAKNRTLVGYSERHHILPKSFGGTDRKENIVRLTAREHFLCHYLLCKMTTPKTKEWYSAVKAFNMMCAGSTFHCRYFNSRLYQYARRHMSETMRTAQAGPRNSQFGSMWLNKDGVAIKVKNGQAQQYLSQGWSTGRTPKKITQVKPVKVVKRPRSAGTLNSQSGTCWINNGVKNAKTTPDNIPVGWIKGRIMSMMK